MHPVTSDLDLSIREYERHHDFKAIHRAHLASEAARASGQVGLMTRMAQAIRQFIDPRGFALDRALRIGSTVDTRATIPAITYPAPVTAFPIAPNQADSAWREAA